MELITKSSMGKNYEHVKMQVEVTQKPSDNATVQLLATEKTRQETDLIQDGWGGVIVGEFLVSQAGIGYLIVYGSQVFKMDLVMASVVLLAIAAAVMYQGIVLIERVLLKKRLK